MNREFLTAEQIVQRAEQNTRTDSNLAIRRQMNKLYRKQDESKLYPVFNRYNITERAIRKARKLESLNDIMSPYEYALYLEEEMSNIVNQEN